MKQLLLLTLIVAQLSVQAVSKPKSLVLITDQITMGITEEEFVALLSETVELEETQSCNVTDLCRYEYVRQLLKDVVRYDEATQSYLAYTAVTKKYVVENTAPLWPRRHRVAFFFCKEYGSYEPFTLFAIHAVHKVEGGNMNTLFEKRLPGASANRPNKTPLLLNTSYYLNNEEKAHARMALWKMDTTREMLFVPDNGMLIFTEFVFLDDMGYKKWKDSNLRYLETMKKARQ